MTATATTATTTTATAPPLPKATLPLSSHLDLIDKVDAFPYESDVEAYAAATKDLHFVTWSDDDGATVYRIGLMVQDVVDRLAAIPAATLAGFGFDTRVDVKACTAPGATVPLWRLLGLQTTVAGRTAALLRLAQHWRAQNAFRALAGWRDEAWPVYASDRATLLFSLERTATGLFGCVRYGIHMTGYTTDPATGAYAIWVPTRAATKETYPGMLDNTVAGGLATGENPFECMVRESTEEANLPADFTRARAVPVPGVMTYMLLADEASGADVGHIYPECEWIYDLPMGDVAPSVNDAEVAGFCAYTVPQVLDFLQHNMFKTNCSVVLLDFLDRHGLLPADDPSRTAIKERLHRTLPFPVADLANIKED